MDAILYSLKCLAWIKVTTVWDESDTCTATRGLRFFEFYDFNSYVCSR